jgi:integrase
LSSVALVAVPKTRARHALDFDCGVRAYPPVGPDGHWRLRWVESGRRRETTAGSHDEVVAKASDLVARLSQGRPTDLAQAHGDVLVAHYLDPARRPVRGRAWSVRHREEQEAYCRRFVSPVIATVELGRLSRLHFAAILAQAPTASVAAHLRRCLSAMVGAGLEEGLLLGRQDVLRGVRWAPPAGEAPEDEETGVGFVEAADIPTAGAVAALAAAAGERSGVWWRELQPLLVAYSGLRWGEMAALTAERVDPARRRITVDRQVIETRHALALSPPKNRRRRTTMYPARTPGGADLAALVARRLAEVGPGDLLFPSPKGCWPRRSNYRRNTFEPAAIAAGWPRRPDGRWAWTFHSLRHVFATWALAQPGARIEDVSRLMGHSTVRVTQDLYISADGDLFERFFIATE